MVLGCSNVTPRDGAAVAVVEGKIYAIGGSDGYGRGYLASGEVYDVATNAWSSIPPMTTARSDAGCAVLGSDIYVIGGRLQKNESVANVTMCENT